MIKTKFKGRRVRRDGYYSNQQGPAYPIWDNLN